MKSLEYIYIQSPTQLRGLGQILDPNDFNVVHKEVEIKIIKVGTWYNRSPDELNEINYLLLDYGHEGILMPKSWKPDSDILNKLDKLLHKAANFDHYYKEACKLRAVYIKYGYIQKRRANEIYTCCRPRKVGSASASASFQTYSGSLGD